MSTHIWGSRNAVPSAFKTYARAGSNARVLLWISFVIVSLACTQAANADLVAVIVNGVPYGPGQPISIPKGVAPVFVKIPGEDLAYYVYQFNAPPPPPKTFRVVSPTGTVTNLGDGSKGKPKQVGNEVIIDYGNGERIHFPGKLLSPGDPNPAPPPDRRGSMDGPANWLKPALALADANLFLQQPELADIFTSPIDLTHFQYDFNGTQDFPVFQRSYSLTFTDGSVDYVHVVPEPSSLFLMVSGVLGLAGILRKKWPTRS